MKSKQVNYAYPSSEIADKYKKPNGCWTVEIGEGGFAPWPKTIISIHDTEYAAIDAAYFIELFWSQNWLDCAERLMSRE